MKKPIDKIFSIVNKGTLTVFDTGEEGFAMNGNVQDSSGNNICAMVVENGDILVIKKNPNHNYNKNYIDYETYKDSETGEKYYWDKPELQLNICFETDNGYVVSMKALELFDKDVIQALVQAALEFGEDVRNFRCWEATSNLLFLE